MKKFLLFLGNAVLVLVLPGCFTYEVLQQDALQDCDKLLNMPDRQQCRNSRSMSKQKYDEEREKLRRQELAEKK
jgi:hypothetical protein